MESLLTGVVPVNLMSPPPADPEFAGGGPSIVQSYNEQT